jgi:hypothetical protein
MASVLVGVHIPQDDPELLGKTLKEEKKEKGVILVAHALQRQKNTKILKQILPEKEYWGLSPNFHIHASVSDLYILMIGLPILLEEICRPILGLYKSLTDT